MAILTGIDVVWTTTPYTVTIARSTGNALIQIEGPGVDASPNYVYSINLTDLHQTLRDFEDSEEGIVKPDIHTWSDPKTVGGVTLAAVLEITNSYRVEFEDGQYAVVLDGANQNISDRIVANQVSIRSKNSAGLQNLDTILTAAYGGAVYVHTINGQSGQSIPLGTRETPVDNFTDAIAIASQIGARKFVLMNSITISNIDFSAGYTFFGDFPTIEVTLDPSADFSNCEFDDISITGTLDGNTVVKGSEIHDLNYVNGYLFNCALSGVIYVDGLAQLTMLDCWSSVTSLSGGADTLTIDMGNAAGNSLAMRNFNGAIKLTNLAGPASHVVSIDFNSGRLQIDSTCAGGTILVRGIADVFDNSTGSVVNDNTINKSISNIATPTATISYKDMILIGELSK